MTKAPKKDRFIPITPYPTPQKEHKFQYYVDQEPAIPQTVLDHQRILATPTKASRFPLAVKDVTHPVIKKTRNISDQPFMVLDAPGCRDDYYIDILDWSKNGTIVVGLGNNVYLWSQHGQVTNLEECVEMDYYSACKVGMDPNQCLVATEKGKISIYSLSDIHAPQNYFNTTGVACCRWISHNEFCVGDRFGDLYYHDQRTAKATSITGFHRDRVVGMAVSPDGQYFATGGNGHLVNLWDIRKRTEPVFVFKQHGSAIKAMDFCPWQPFILSTGGGREDGQICFFNIQSGKLLRTIETIDQVCQLKWSTNYKELVSSSARSTEQIVIWDISRLDRPRDIKTLAGHQSRPMYMAISPDGSTIATLGGDEMLKFFKCFETIRQPLFDSNPRIR